MDLNAQRGIILDNHFRNIGFVILFYDHLLTLPDEIKYIWSQPRSLGSLWFFVNRYFNFFGNLTFLLITELMPQTEQSCAIYGRGRGFFLFIAQFLIIVLLILRTYALYGRSRKMLYFLIVVVVCGLCGVTWPLFGEDDSKLISLYGCISAVTQTTATRIAVPWWANFAFDALIFGLTLHRTWSTPRTTGELRQHDLVYILWRDGALNFGVMALAYLLSLMTFYFFPPSAKVSLASTASSIAVSMASRLLLNLRHFSEHASSRPLASIPVGPPGARSSTHAIVFAPNPALADVGDEDAADEAVDAKAAARDMPRTLGGRGRGEEAWELEEMGARV